MAKKLVYTTNTPSASTDYAAADGTWKPYSGGGGGGAGSIIHGTASGTDTYTVTLTGVTSYADGDAYLIRFTNGNTTGCTLNVNSLGAKDLYRNNDGLLIGGDIEDGAEMLCIYNSTINGFQLIGTSPNTLLAYVTNVNGSTITKGQPVYAFGGTGDRLTVKLASNLTDATSAQTVGLVLSSSIAANQKGLIILNGQLDGLSILPTSTFADGDPVYLGATAGTVTNVKPLAPNHLVYLGFVTTASPGSAGRMYVRVQNGYEMDEIHDVQISTYGTKDVLWRDTSVNLWKNKDVFNLIGATSAEVGHLSGVTSNIQTQLNSKIASSVSFISNIIALAFNGAASPVTRFHSIASGLSSLPNPCQIPVPTACTFSNFYFRIYGAQPATGSLVLTLQKNVIDTAVTITIAAGSAIGVYSDTTNSATFSAGDTWQLKLVQNATSGNTTLGGYSFKLSGL